MEGTGSTPEDSVEANRHQVALPDVQVVSSSGDLDGGGCVLLEVDGHHIEVRTSGPRALLYLYGEGVLESVRLPAARRWAFSPRNMTL